MLPAEAMRAAPATFFAGLLIIVSNVALLILLVYPHSVAIAIGTSAVFQGFAYVILLRICERRARARGMAELATAGSERAPVE